MRHTIYDLNFVAYVELNYPAYGEIKNKFFNHHSKEVTMKKSQGFTLIELVIVIVILGILGAVAAPKFLNLQGDAYKANVNALKNSVQSAATLANAKATLQGKEKISPVTIEGIEVAFSGGFPAASSEGIILMLQDSESFNSDAESDSAYIIKAEKNTLSIAPRNRGIQTLEGEKCQVEYTQKAKESKGEDDENIPASELSVKAFTDGC